MSEASKNFQFRQTIAENGNRQETSTKEQFSERLSSCINSLGLNDSEVSRLSGIPRSAFTRYRKAESYPDALAIFALADALRVNPRWLLTGQGSQLPEVRGDFIDPEGEEQLTWHFRCISTEHRQALLTVAAAMASADALSLDDLKPASAEERARFTLHSPTTEFRPEKEGGTDVY
jgi:transcriptional regulator with XRE-family HTH domain